MNFLIFSKHSADQGIPLICDWDLSQVHKITGEVSKSGALGLLSESSYKALAENLRKLQFCYCGIKKDKVELFRSFQFDDKSARKQPKILIFPGSDKGALKRSIRQFFAKRYSAADPPCLIVVHDDLLEATVKDFQAIVSKKDRQRKKYSDNPIRLLLEETANDPVIEEISEVYIGSSYEMRMARLMILKASQATSPVLILGETGTGKDIIAQQIGKHSKYYRKSFAVVNCAALPETLLEGELFGYKQGIYTGANRDKDGLLVAHKGGTVFLDEIGDLSLANQAKLLVAIEGKKVRPIGGTDTVSIDVRIIAATNRNVDYMARNGSFREDLLQRLNFLRIFAPSLRSHRDDIPAIADHIWEKLNHPCQLSKAFHEHLKSWPWPGNVRELKSLLTSIKDIYGNDLPTPAHIESIRNYHNENIPNVLNSSQDDKAQLLKLEAKLRLVNLQNIVRGIKVMMRPVINQELKPGNFRNESEKIRHYFEQQIQLIDDLCREPVYFKDYGLFKETTRYRYLLEKMLKHWPSSAGELQQAWSGELQKLDEDITLGILKLIWGTMDM